MNDQQTVGAMLGRFMGRRLVAADAVGPAAVTLVFEGEAEERGTITFTGQFISRLMGGTLTISPSMNLDTRGPEK